MRYTTHYGLKKPDPEDFYNIGDFNHNADTLDAAMKDLSAATRMLTLSSLSLPAGGWEALTQPEREALPLYSGEQPPQYRQTITVPGALPGMTGLFFAPAPSALWRRLDPGAGTLTLYAHSQPAGDIQLEQVLLFYTREVSTS